MSTPTSGFNRTLFALYALAIALCGLIPLPVVDRLAANLLRRRMVGELAKRHDHALPEDGPSILGDDPGGGCMGCLWAVLIWPVKKLLKYVFFFLEMKEIMDDFFLEFHRALLLDEALRKGWIGEDLQKVRVAVDKTLELVQVRPIEKAWWGRFGKTADAEWSARVAAVADREAGRDDPDHTPAFDVARKTRGASPDVLIAFRNEMGEAPKLESKVAGVIEPELLPADPLPVPFAPTSAPDDAHEVVQLPQPKKD